MAKITNNNSKFDIADPLTLTIIIGGGFLFIVFFWVGLHGYISMIYTYIRYAMSYPVYIISSFFKDIPVLSYPYNYIQQYCAPESGLLGLCQRDFDKFSWSELKQMSLPWNIFFGFLLSYSLLKDFVRASNRHPQAVFSKVHSFDSFLKEQQNQFFHLKLFNNIDLINEPINHPLYGMSLTSSQFVGIYALTRNDEPLDWQSLPDGSFAPIIDQEALREVLIVQLGKPFAGFKKLSNTELVIFSILLPLVAATDPEMQISEFNEAKTISEDIREKIWLMFENKPEITTEQRNLKLDEDELASLWLMDLNIDRSEFYKIIEKFRIAPIVREILPKHAYIKTLIYALLLKARQVGVLSPAELRWLRFCDRPLWYVIQSVGRNRPFIEAAAVYDHFNYENLMGKAYPCPYIKNAILGVHDQVNSFKYKNKNLLKGNYDTWLKWRPESLRKLYPGLDVEKSIENIKKII